MKPSARSSESTLRPICGFLAFAVPLLVTALRASASPQWRDDLAIVQSLGFVPVGGEGTPSALLAQLAALLPLGGRVLRAGLVGAVGAAVAGRAIHGIALELLGIAGTTRRLSPALALAAALTATLSPTFQHEGTAAGGATLATGLALATVLLRVRLPGEDVRGAFALGCLVGLTAAESRLAALAVVVALAVRALARSELPSRRAFAAELAGAVLVAAFCAVPLLLRPLTARSFLSLGSDVSSRATLTTDHALAAGGAVARWIAEMGPVALALGVVGAASGFVRRAPRPDALLLAVLVVAALVFAPRGGSVLAADPLAALTLLALAALSLFAVLGVQTAAVFLAGARIPFAGPASVLLVVFHFTLVFGAAESSSGVADEERGLGADVWTDEALGELPFRSLLIVRSPTLAWRIWAARAARGDRPDLVVVPLGMVGRAAVARSLVTAEPALAPLIRDVAMTGRTSEFALATLADARPLFVELDPEWDRRLFAHLRPTPLWLGFTAHPLGRSDRTLAVSDDAGRRAFRRVLGVAQSVPGGDAGTLAVLAARAREQAVVLAALGDKDSARRVLSDITRIEPESPFAVAVEEKIREHAGFDARALLR